MKLKLRTKWDNFCISYYILNYNSIMKITRSRQNCKLKKKKKPELFLLDLARQKTSSNFKQTLQNLVESFGSASISKPFYIYIQL